MRRAITIRLLGDYLVTFGEIPVTGLASAHLQSLLALLLLRRDAPQSRQYIAFQLWPEYSEAQARAALRGTLHLLRKRLPEADRYLAAQGTTLQWQPEADFELDVACFEKALDHARAVEQEGNLVELRMALEEAVGLYRGDLLPGCYDDWIVDERQGLRECFLVALYRLSEVAQSLGDVRAAVGYAQQLVRHDPLREVAYRRLIELHLEAGDYAAGLHIYQICVRVLRHELGVAPNEATRALSERLVRAAPTDLGAQVEVAPSFGAWLRRRRRALGLTQEALAQRVGCAAITIRKLEAGSQKASRQIAELLAIHLDLDLEDRRAFVQYARGDPDGKWLAASNPAPDTSGADRCAASNLPAQTTSFIGRKAEVTWLRAALRQSTTRLVTLSGPPGIGKTRLAQQVAGDLCDYFAHGVYFVPLATISDAALLAPTIARTLGLQDEGAKPPIRSLITFLRNKRVLLVLDNLEQLAGAAPLLAELLAEVPELTLLVTSRAVLGLRGEKQLRVPLLALPEDGQSLPLAVLREYESVGLFVERAQDANAYFELNEANAALVCAIVRKLEGIPLAIEIAAARTKLMQLPTMLTWLERRLHVLSGGPVDLPARQQTLRSAIDWSYNLLSSQEQLLFRRLGVFVGGWTLAAAESVCDEQDARDLERGSHTSSLIVHQSSLDLLASLVDKSLVRQEPGVNDESRFTMLETIRDYALERLQESGELEPMRRKHAEYYLALAEEGRRQLQGPAQFTWLALFDEDSNNLRVALDWSELAAERATLGLRLAAALARFWWTRGYLSEGLAQLASCLARTEGQLLSMEVTTARAQAFYGSGRLALLKGDFALARMCFEQSLDLFEQLDDAEGVTSSLSHLGIAVGATGDLARERALVEKGLEVARRVDSKAGTATALFILGTVSISESDYERTIGLLTESLALAREVWDMRVVGICLFDLGRVEVARANFSAARTYYEESLALFRKQGDRVGSAMVLNLLGSLERRCGEYRQAADFLEQSRAMLEELDARHQLADTLYELGELAFYQGDLQSALQLHEQSLNLSRTLGLSLLTAGSLRGIARVALALTDIGQAAALLRESLSLFRKLNAKGEIAYSLIDISALAITQNKREQGTLLLAAVASAIESIGLVLPPVDQARFDADVQVLRQDMEETRFAAAWVAGHAVSLDEAANYALEQLPSYSPGSFVKHFNRSVAVL